MKIFKKAKRGFTLVELVVVIAVIAILAAVSVGAYFGVTESANKSKLEQESKQFHTAIQTVALIGNENHTLNADGLRVNDIETFEDAIEKQMGQDVEVMTDNPAKIGKQTIVLKTDVLQKENTPTVYKTFQYYSPEVGGKAILVDVVTGDFKHVSNLDFTIDTEDQTEAEYITFYFENNWKWPEPAVYYWGSEKVECPPNMPGDVLTKVVGKSGAGDDIYEVTIPADVTGFLFNGNNEQSIDLTIAEDGYEDKNCYYMIYTDGQKKCDRYHFDPSAVTPDEEEPERLSDYFIKGSFTENAWSDEIYLLPVENSTNEYSVTLENIKVDDEFKIFTTERGFGFGAVEQPLIYFINSGEYANIKAAVEGTYNITFNTETQKITYRYTGGGEPLTIEKTTIYFADFEGYEKVYVHYWGGLIASEWPGVEMVKDGDYYVAEIETASTGLKIHNNSNPEVTTGDQSFDSSKPYYVNGEWVTDPNATTEPENPGEGGETPSEPEATINTKKVYFINNDLEPWAEVYVYCWGSTQIEEMEWPGVRAHQDESNSKIWSFEVPNDVTGFNFNNKNNGKQTTNLIFEEGKDYYDCILKKFVESYCEHNFENNAVSCPLCNEENPNYEDPNAEKQHLYLKPNSNWKIDSARFALVLMDSNKQNHTWFNMVDTDGDGIYEAELDYSDFKYVIFCRMNPGAAANNWNNKWNQTSDLTIPTDGTNCYTIQEGSWDKGAWSTK